jgi:hypothetical protein
MESCLVRTFFDPKLNRPRGAGASSSSSSSSNSAALAAACQQQAGAAAAAAAAAAVGAAAGHNSVVAPASPECILAEVSGCCRYHPPVVRPRLALCVHIPQNPDCLCPTSPQPHNPCCTHLSREGKGNGAPGGGPLLLRCCCCCCTSSILLSILLTNVGQCSCQLTLWAAGINTRACSRTGQVDSWAHLGVFSVFWCAAGEADG